MRFVTTLPTNMSSVKNDPPTHAGASTAPNWKVVQLRAGAFLEDFPITSKLNQFYQLQKAYRASLATKRPKFKCNTKHHHGNKTLKKTVRPSIRPRCNCCMGGYIKNPRRYTVKS